ncbi:heterogeneous nuclear ribonucleoprotein 1 isoform X1 [Euphorbia lathyris]|uniref:heterogeneous nuclear ribonucleoprotein 1 isoform X1 n=2 Tax=Euphorbia lathyris TaxID=212925 RepID=UPI0033141F70
MESDLGKLFIGGISWDTDEERLKEYFSKYGEVVEAVIMRDRTTGRARGFGFVVFADPAVAERVIMDKHMIDGRTVEAKKAVPRDDQHILNRNTSSIHGSPGPGRTKKIFVGGLASTVTDGDFKKYFEQFGNITDVVVMYDHNTQRPRGFGFITYDSEDAVDRVLHKTFHELNGKMVEVKRAVPKELSPGPSRSPLIGYNYGLSRTNNFLNAYAQGYNMNSVGGFGMRMDSRFSPIASGRSGFPPFGTTGYGVGMNLEPGLSPNYGGGSNFGNSPGYGRMLNPYYSGNSNRYSTPIGYGMGNARNDSGLSPTTRNVWGNGGLSSAANPPSPGGFLNSGGGSFGVSLGNSGANWGGPSHVSAQGGGNASGYTNVSLGYGSGGDNNYGLGGGGYGRNTGSGPAPTSSFAGSTGGYEGSYGDLYRNSSVYGDSTWRSSTPELDGSVAFGYGLGNIASDVTAKSSEGYIGSYGVTSRQSNRGIAT